MIATQSARITVWLPERDERFRTLVRGLGYQWNRPAGLWERTIVPQFHGTVQDRVIELAHSLLQACFVVGFPDGYSVEAIANGEFEEECRRWVKVRLSGTYKDWFVLQWPRGDDFYTAARRIHGSRYDSPFVIAPPDSYAEVLDFTDRYGFRLSDGAKRVVTEAQSRYEAAVMVIPQARRKSSPPNAQTVGTIDLELLDDMEDDNTTLSLPANRD